MQAGCGKFLLLEGSTVPENDDDELFSEARGLAVGWTESGEIQVSNELTDTHMSLLPEQLDGVIGMLGIFRMNAEVMGELEDGE